MKVYLCGPINGCTDAEARDWREAAKARFPDHLDPMKRDYRGKEDESVNEIVILDKREVESVDVLLVNAPAPSWGTAMEIKHAWDHGVPCIVVVPAGTRISPWLRYHATKIVHSFEDAYAWIEASL